MIPCWKWGLKDASTLLLKMNKELNTDTTFTGRLSGGKVEGIWPLFIAGSAPRQRLSIETVTIHRFTVVPLVLLFCLVFLSSLVWCTSLPAQTQPRAVEVVDRMVQAETAAMKNRQRFQYTREVRSTRTKGHLWNELVVETPEGRMHRLLSEDGKPLSAEQAKAEDDRIANLVNHPDDFRREGQGRRDDEGRLARLLQDLPKAFLFASDGNQGGCTRITFRPNPSFEEQSYEDRVVHAMSGELFIHTADMRLCGIDAHLDHKVEFGFGLLGEVSDDSSFSITREEVLPGQWKTARLRVHVNGSMLLLKSFSRDEDSSHYGFKKVDNNLSVAQAAAIACANGSSRAGSLARPSARSGLSTMILFSSSSLPKTHSRRLILIVPAEESAH